MDQAVLRELQVDARQTNKRLAEAVHVSQSTALLRVRSLEERGVIRGYHADVTMAALGRLTQAYIAVKLQPKTPEVVAGFVDSVWRLEETVAVAVMTGANDVLIRVSVSSNEQLANVLLRHISSSKYVVNAETSVIFEYRQKHVLGPAELA